MCNPDKETRRQGDKETRRQGDKETRRQGDKETTNLFVRVSYYPILAAINHCYEHAQHLVVGLVERQRLFAVQVSTPHGKLDPYLCFCGLAFRVRQLGYEGSLVP